MHPLDGGERAGEIDAPCLRSDRATNDHTPARRATRKALLSHSSARLDGADSSSSLIRASRHLWPGVAFLTCTRLESRAPSPSVGQRVESRVAECEKSAVDWRALSHALSLDCRRLQLRCKQVESLCVRRAIGILVNCYFV